MDRREFVSSASLAIGALGIPMIGHATGMASGEPIAETRAGKVRGVNNAGIYTFKGIPYGADISGAGRFMPPRKPAPWAGVRDCLKWGPACPQGATGTPPATAATAMGGELGLVFSGGDTNSPYNEDCLVLNVFTRGLADGAKRPVMVWIHGGGFTGGTGAGARTDGTNLARNHDVVSVSLNHRLGVLGYCHLGDLDGRFAASGNVGQLDLVAALQWVRDNIAAFGGDPHNVTIHGESGGGGKVHLLMAMPAAKGLFHRAVSQSGSIRPVNYAWGLPPLPTRAQATEAAAGLLKDAGLSAGQIGDLQQLPIEKLFAAASRPGHSFAPVIGTAEMPVAPNIALANGSARIPYLLGSAKHEYSFVALSGGIDLKSLSDAQLRKISGAAANPKLAEVVDGYGANHPDYSRGELLVRIMSDGMRIGAIRTAEAHIRGGGAPTFMYLFDWESPVLPNLKACHGSDCSFYFGDTEALGMSKGNPEARALSAKMSTAWTGFARSGSPAARSLPWPAYDTAKRATMVFTGNPQIIDDPMGADRKLWDKFLDG